MQSTPKIYDDFQAFQLAYQFDFADRGSKVGNGNYGEVIKGKDKEWTPGDLICPSDWVAIKRSFNDEDASVQREYEVAKAKDLDHPNVMRYLAYGRLTAPHVGVRDYLVMPYYPDGNLHQYIRNNTLTPSQIRSLVKGILSGLAYLHSQKCQHRDLKGSNILIGRDPKTNEMVPVIADFGSAKQVKQSNSESFSQSEHAKTIANAAPEQIRGESSVNYNVDLWAFGVILYEIMTGEHPFNYGLDHLEQTTARKMLTNRIVLATLPEETLKSIPVPYQTMIRRCLVVERQKRVQKAEDLLTVLDNCDAPEPVTDPVTPTQKIYSKKSLSFIYYLGGPLALTLVYGENLKVVHDSYKPSVLWRSGLTWIGIWIVTIIVLNLFLDFIEFSSLWCLGILYWLMWMSNLGLLLTLDNKTLPWLKMREKIDSYTKTGGSTFSEWRAIGVSISGTFTMFVLLFIGLITYLLLSW